jgi:hypothetical protein
MRLVELSLGLRLFLWYSHWGCRRFYLVVFGERLCFCGGFVFWVEFC